MKYIIIQYSDIKKINFSKILEDGESSLRFSVDRKKFILKYEEEQPEFAFGISQDSIGLPEYTHEEILNILKGPEWTRQF